MKGGRGKPKFVVTPDNRVVRRDVSEHEMWLAVHGVTKGGAYVVSRDGERGRAVTIPIKLLDLGEPHGAIADALIYPASGPGFVFDEKGLR